MTGLSRREVLRSGGMLLTIGAIGAACASDEAGGAPGRIGIAPPPPTLPEVESPPADVTLLRTMQSIELAAVELYNALIATGALTADEAPLFDRILEDHTRHAEEMAGLITQAGGEEFACPNAFFMERSVDPALDAMEGSDDVHRDVLNIAWAFESNLGASYQSFVPMYQALDLRSSSALTGSEEHRHATVLARIINPEETFAPSFFGEPDEATDADGFPIPYAIPSVFGRLGPIDLVVGATNEEGARFTTQLQTPAENTFVYEYMSCPA
jgi:hypothetical protein